MLGFAAFVALIAAFLLPRVLRAHFPVGWWTLTFPSAAFATLCLAYAQGIPHPGTAALAAAAPAFASLVVAPVSAPTVAALARGDLLPMG